MAKLATQLHNYTTSHINSVKIRSAEIKIFINNFPEPVRKLVPIAHNGKKNKNAGPTMLAGFDMGGEAKALFNNAMSKFFLSFILYDEVIITDSDFKKIISHIGLENSLVLLESKKIKLIYDKIDFGMEFLNPAGSRLKLTNHMIKIPVISYIDKNFGEFSNKKSLQSKFIQYMDNALLKNVQSLEGYTNTDIGIYDNAYHELIREVDSSEISRKYLSGVESVNDMDPYQSTKVIRLLNTLKGFSFQEKSGADVILQDAFSKDYLNSKLTFLLRDEPTDKVEFFSEIAARKGIPDIYYLFRNNVISIHNIVDFSTANESTFFRNWFLDDGVSKEDVYFKLMNNKNESTINKGIRWLYPNIVGLINPILGAVVSGADSFIIDKIAKGWSPNVFLDDVLKSNIDLLINKNERLIKRREIINRFGSVKPNAPCPCQSGLKFKKCHGY